MGRHASKHYRFAVSLHPDNIMTTAFFPNAPDEVGPGGPREPTRTAWQRMMATKPRDYILMEEDEELQTSSVGLTRQLGLFDLLMIGIGGTVGTGVFALAGLIAHEDAGPAVILSWAVAAFGCTLNGFAYMEMSSLVPSSGSVYAYSYHALGEVFAVVAAWCLTLEYGVSGAAVARSWGTKVVYWIQDISGDENTAEWMDREYYSLSAAFMQALCVGLLLCGLSLGKHLVNAMTIIKIVLIIFMTTAAFTAFESENLSPFIPPEFGAGGVLTGGTAAFFGFIGFDEVCCMAGEAKNPTKIMPKAVVGTIIGSAQHSMLDTDLYRAPVRSSGWVYNNRRDRSKSYCQTEASAPRLVDQTYKETKQEPLVASSVP